MASIAEDLQTKACDPYRSYISQDTEKETLWRHGGPPNYDIVNALFEAERTKVWEKGSVEETIENLVKTWEMELFHKARSQDMKTVDSQKFSIAVNGRPPLNMQEIGKKGGGYNVFLETSLEEVRKCYDSSEETFNSSHEMFKRVFPGGFAWEVLQVYSPPPQACFKFRHWGRMDGPFKSHPASHRTVQFTGVATILLDEKGRITSMEVFYDPAELLAGFAQSQCPFQHSS